ncbi:Putative secreted resuscitation-promoting factor interacting protein [Corynebacterium glyciniphilum AJ 3170]|uniref:Putative secreted resuscitation-promoting factor interacting protein n=1 Tax=Corynebacterium glyciniphilum AJ 3170 TaxID=1404245 RepID=X5E9S2_9CORY|nr:C40 family peptidase [Corynebacterium glyciniphilum]AHW64165.1 Putative secreted resuscitation-promoting factor interacting protein [Corynebacterium glyciniphilum AJ 3170]
MALRLNARGTARRSTVRSTRALLSFAVAAGLTVPAATAVAAPSDNSSSSSDQTAEAYLAELVGAVSTTEGEVSSLELELGGLRESVNKARVDVDRSQRAAQEAQDNVTDARSRLDDSDSDVQDAQSTLDDIARSAYTQGGDAAPVVLASGSDATADNIDRATYMRLAAEKQQADIDRLDLARTQAANEESSLRVSRDDADGLVKDALEAHSAAERAFTDAQSSIAEKSKELTRVKNSLSEAKDRLTAAKKAVDKLSANAAASSFDKRRAAEAAADRVAATDETADDTAHTEDAGTTGTTDASGTSGAVDMKDDVVGPETPAPSSGSADGSAVPEDDQSVPEDPDIEGSTGSTGSIAGDDAEVDPDGEGTPDVEGDLAEDPAAGSAEVPGLDAIPGSFEGSSEGDELRQAAIDGLINAAGQAAFAGINSHLEGNPDGAFDAAATAGRDAAAEAYENLPQGQEGVEPGLPPSNPGGEQPAEPDASGSREEQIERVIDRGMSQLGVTYAWGGGNQDGPTLGVRDGGVADSHGDYSKVGFDCSGLMVYSFAAVGIQLEKYSGYQYTSGTQIPVGDAQRGDMLFWGAGGSSHVALYLGDGTMLEAPQSGDVVKVSPVRWDGIEPMAVRMIE